MPEALHNYSKLMNNYYDQVDQSQFPSFSVRSIFKWYCLQQLYQTATKTPCYFLKVHNIPFISCLLYCNPVLCISESFFD